MNQNICFLSLILTLAIFIASTSMVQSITDIEFIETSCSKTSLPSECKALLLPYAAAVHSVPSLLASEALTLALTELDNLKGMSNQLPPLVSGPYANCIGAVQHSFVDLANSVTTNPSSLFVPTALISWSAAAIEAADSCTLGFLTVGLSPTLADAITSDTISAAKTGTIALDLTNSLIN